MGCEGRVAIVTGAAGSGMGRSIALTLAREGARVVVNYRTSAAAAAAIVEHIEGRGGEATAVQADVFEADECARLMAGAVERFGQVDICIVGPGGGWHPEPLAHVGAVGALDDVRHELAVIYHLMPLVLPGMYEREWGRVVAISLAPPYESPAYAYNVGKAARTHAILLAQEKAWQRGVTLNVIGPGPVPEIEDLTLAAEQRDHGPAWQQRSTASPQDIAEGVAFLCSDCGRFITGCILPYSFRD
ncbi:MAG: SDR family oxidoreductase [Anaerolineae bacterium]|nr:SDR family oxidoreductase [Anaerolineae bacterium]